MAQDGLARGSPRGPCAHGRLERCRWAFAAAAFLLLACGARADGQPAGAQPGPAAGPAPEYPLSAFSALGSSFALGNRLTELGWSDAQVSAFVEGIRAAFAGRPFPFDDAAKQVSAEMGRRVQALQGRAAQQALAQPYALKQFMTDTSRRLGLDESDSGLCYALQAVGRGDRAGPEDSVVIGCLAVAPDGQTKLAELSSERFTVKVADLLPGLREGVLMMAVGSQGTFLVPPGLSFGDGAWPSSVERGSPILFRVTLFEVVRSGAKK